MGSETLTSTEPIQLETCPTRYRHWRLSFEPPIAHLTMAVAEDQPFAPGAEYKLKLNSYDIGVDLELADAVQRLRFEHPEIRAVLVTSAQDRCFCAGANIFMLGSSAHGFKVNFCKYTNETRLAIEDASASSGQHYIAACNGTTAGGGYELAMACERIFLVDDGSAAVSLPETPLLGVLPGTGGLTRLVDKRKVRRDLADVFATLAEGVKGKRAVEWGLVDGVFPRSRFDDEVKKRALELALATPEKRGPGVPLPELAPEFDENRIRYRHVEVTFDVMNGQAGARTAQIVVRAPDDPPPATAEAVRAAGAENFWPLAVFREFDDALVRLRLDHPETGVVILKTVGDPEKVLAHDRILESLADDWFVREVRLAIARTLRRLDLTAKSLFALVEEGSAFAGTLFELALAADRSYMFDDGAGSVKVSLGPANSGWYPMTHGPSRLAVRFLGAPAKAAAALEHDGPIDAPAALAAGLVTFALDEIDWEDEIRIAIEERASLSPDSLTGMEANLRFPGAENMESKIFGRLSAWQNWIFQRPNAVGEHGALTLYGRPERPRFDMRRT